jgi:hypothetical protein
MQLCLSGLLAKTPSGTRTSRYNIAAGLFESGDVLTTGSQHVLMQTAEQEQESGEGEAHMAHPLVSTG